MSKRIKKGDIVLILSGKDKGKREKVVTVFPKEDKVLVERVMLVKKHQRSTRTFQGGIIEKPMPIAASKAMIVCPNCHTPTRIAIKIIAQGKKIRICKRCNQGIDKV